MKLQIIKIYKGKETVIATGTMKYIWEKFDIKVGLQVEAGEKLIIVYDARIDERGDAGEPKNRGIVSLRDGSIYESGMTNQEVATWLNAAGARPI